MAKIFGKILGKKTVPIIALEQRTPPTDEQIEAAKKVHSDTLADRNAKMKAVGLDVP